MICFVLEDCFVVTPLTAEALAEVVALLLAMTASLSEFS
jgi:hypothetical protein